MKWRESLNLRARIRRMASRLGSDRPTLIMKNGDRDSDYQWTAEVTTSQGTWRSPPTMPYRELRWKLLFMGINKDEIQKAEIKAYVEKAEFHYRRLEMEYLPFLQAALAGEREVPEQRPFTEGWLAYALFCHDEISSLNKVIGSADAENHSIPTYDEISWAFLRLRRRGWLAVEGDLYGLMPEGHRAVKEIVDKDEPPWPEWSHEQWTAYVLGHGPRIGRTWALKKLEDWISDNPPPGDE